MYPFLPFQDGFFSLLNQGELKNDCIETKTKTKTKTAKEHRVAVWIYLKTIQGEAPCYCYSTSGVKMWDVRNYAWFHGVLVP